MAQDLAALTNTWMLNPYMFDPSQQSNAFSNYNGAALPWPPTYNGAPVNAATGKPIQSFQNWQAANPGGMSINSTPAQPAAPAPSGNPFAGVQDVQGQNTPASQQRGGLSIPQWQALSPQQRSAAMGPIGQYQAGNAMMPSGGFVASGSNPSGSNPQASNALAWMNSGLQGYNQMGQQQGAPQAAQQAGGASAPPNNWQAALSALANPGNPTTQGATVPMVSGSQPAGGVNQAFLNQAGAGAGMNQNFLSALRAIQARPQG